MARGQILTIPNQSGVLVTTLSREQKASLSMLNPNDGICYVKINSNAGPTQANWDWKVPSQSYCQLPGPWESLGVYYLDQSGSGRTAEVNVYELDSQISVPSFIAIGRAVQSAGTTMDITQGAQPANPPASTVRLWADANGDLHVLTSGGVDQTVLDSNTQFAGDVYNVASNMLIQGMYGRNSDGWVVINQRASLRFAGGGYLNDYGSQGLIGCSGLTVTPGNLYAAALIVNGPSTLSGNVAVGGTLTVSGNGTFNAAATFNGTTTVNVDLTVSRNNNTGYIWLGNNSQHYIGFDGTQYIMPNGLLNIQSAGISAQGNISANGTVSASGNITASGQVSGGTAIFSSWAAISTVYLNSTSAAPYIQNAGTSVRYWASGVHSFEGSLGGGYGQINAAILSIPSPDSGRIQFTNSGHAQLCGSGYFAVAGGTNNNSCTLFSNGNAGGVAGWQVISSKRWKENIVEIKNALAIINKVSAYHYTANPPKDKDAEGKEIVVKSYDAYGFVAEDWLNVAPEVTSLDESGLPLGMDYGQVTAILLAAFQDYVNATEIRLKRLESGNQSIAA